MTDEPTTPNPGSADAIKAGCTCAVLDNCHGLGYHRQAGVFIFTAGCPVHWRIGEKLGPFTAVSPPHPQSNRG